MPKVGGTVRFLVRTIVVSDQWPTLRLILDGTSVIRPDGLIAYWTVMSLVECNASQLWEHGDDIGIGRISNATKYHTGDASSNADGFAGLIDEVRIYNRALSVLEIEMLAGQGDAAGAVGSVSDAGGLDLPINAFLAEYATTWPAYENDTPKELTNGRHDCVAPETSHCRDVPVGTVTAARELLFGVCDVCGRLRLH